MDSRIDAEPGALAVMIPVPADLAAQWPVEFGQQPHVSVVIADPVTDAQALECVLVVADELYIRWSDIGRSQGWNPTSLPTSGPNATTLALDGLAYFDLPNDRVAFARVQVTEALRQIRGQIADRFQNLSVSVRNAAQWVPHATLARVPVGANYTGPIPSGSWPLKTIEVWRDDTRYILTPEDSTIDKMVKSAAGWDAWTQAGRTSIGSFPTEADAREGLRVANLEFILRGRHDGERTEAERDVISIAFATTANMPPAEFKAWLDSAFSGPSRKSGVERTSARKVADLVLGLLQSNGEDWTQEDYDSAAKIVAQIERMASAEPGSPLEVDGREGPTARDAELMDLGYDPHKDACKIREDRADARAGWIWRTQADDRVRPTHAELDGQRYDVNQRDANHGIPGEEFGCRCYPEIAPQRGTRREADAIERVTARAKRRAAERWRKDFGPISEDTVKAWLVEHISDVAKMSRPRMLALKALEGTYPYLAPPAATTVHRGLRNIVPASADSWPAESDPIRDKSWSLVRSSAERFARGEWTLDTPIAGRVGVLIEATADPSLLLLNPELLAALPGVGDYVHPIWNEPLSKAIRDEQEVLALGSMPIIVTTKVPMLARADRKDARWLTTRRRKDRAPAVHTESRTHVDHVLRTDAVELLPPEFLPNGWRRYSVLYSRTGCQTYYPNGVAVVEWRSPSEVFSPASLDSGRGLPWELRHSPDLLRPDTVQGVAQGCTLTFEPHADGIHTAGIAQAWGLDLFDAIDGREAVQVSLAYGCKVDRRPGTTDDGQRFDQRQIAILLNSLASEPSGRAGTARVITERLDSSPVITRRDSLLALANSGRIVRPVHFDRTNWRPASPRKDTDDMMIPNEILMAMLAAAKKTMAEVAAAVGVSEADAVKLLTGEVESSPEQLAMIKAAMMVERDDAPAGMAPPKMPAMPAMVADTMVKIGDADVMLPAAAAHEIITLRERAAMASERADSADVETRRVRTELAAKGDMISRTDAAAMVLERGMQCADLVAMCRAANGDDWTPSARKDAAGKAFTHEDLQRAVITAVLPGADAILTRVDSYPPSARASVLTERVEDARRILVARGNKSLEVKREIAENLAGITVAHKDGAKPGPVAAAELIARANAGAIKTANA